MNITLGPELFETDFFKNSFAEKLKSARYFDYDPPTVLKGIPLKHYDYGRAVKGVLAEMAVIGYLLQTDIGFIYNYHVDKRKYSPDIDLYIPDKKLRIDVKSGMSFWKKDMLLKYAIDYVIVAEPSIVHLPFVYKHWNYTLVKSYRQLFKNAITVKINGFISISDILEQGPTYELKPIEELF